MALEDIQRIQKIQKVAQSPQTMDDMEQIIRPEVKRAMEADQAIMKEQRLAPPPIMADIPPELRTLETEAARQIEQQRQPQPNRVEDMLRIQETVQRGDMKDKISLMAEQQTPISTQQVPMMPQQPSIASNIPTDQEKAETADKVVKIAAWDGLLERAGITEEQLNSTLAGLMGNTVNEFKASKEGGLIGMAAGGDFSGKVPGQGHGMEDNVYMPIVERERGQQVATLAVSPDEYVVDAHTMSALGNGNADEGARYMDAIVKNIRKKAFGTDQQPNEINGLAALRPMIERV